MDPRSLQVAAVFDLASATYDDVGVPWFGPIASGLVDVLAPRAGEVVLDVGRGKGAATFAIADHIGPEGRVLGLDASQGMLTHAQRLADARGVRNVEARCASPSPATDATVPNDHVRHGHAHLARQIRRAEPSSTVQGPLAAGRRAPR